MSNFIKGFKLTLSDNHIKFRHEEFYKKINDRLVRIPNKKNENIQLVYFWNLYRMTKLNKDFELCSFARPLKDIGNGLEENWVLLNLNLGEVFDFEYYPKEKDNLIISTNESFKMFLSFIFEENEWKIDYHIPFMYDIEEIGKGLVKEI